MSLAIVAEKPSLLEAFSKTLPEFYPHIDFNLVPVYFPVFEWFASQGRFKIPHGTKWRELPVTSEVRYRPMSCEASRSQLGTHRRDGGAHFLSEAVAKAYLDDANEILVLVDGNGSSLHMAHHFISEIVGDKRWRYITAPWIVDLSDGGIQKAMTEARPIKEFGLPLIAYGATKRYFEYNYLLNARPLIGAAAREAGLYANIPSKFGLQLLYQALDAGRQNDGLRIQSMARWNGTGKYDGREYDMGLGSPASRATIVEQLVAGGFMSRSLKASTEVTDEGRQFLDLLHPDCRDPDLPFRLHDWCKLPEEDAHKAIDRYIRTFFGRQKTFFEKHRNAVAA